MCFGTISLQNPNKGAVPSNQIIAYTYGSIPLAEPAPLVGFCTGIVLVLPRFFNGPVALPLNGQQLKTELITYSDQYIVTLCCVKLAVCEGYNARSNNSKIRLQVGITVLFQKTGR